MESRILILRMVMIAAICLLVPDGLESRGEILPKNLWQPLEPGLEISAFVPSQKSQTGDSLVHILRIDLNYFEFRLLNASRDPEDSRKSVREWVQSHNLVAGINASMYQKDNLTSVSYMKSESHVNSSWVSKDRAMLAFNPKEKSFPPAKIFDRDCEKFKEVRKQYASLIQSIRMVSCRRENVWAPQPDNKWSTAAIGMDSKGRFLFIHVRSPYSTHDLINILLDLPIDLQRAMYVEGGKDAQLYINTASDEFEFLGNYSAGSSESEGNHFSWPVPNVLGIARIPQKK